MTFERFEMIRDHYWVLAFEGEKAVAFDWLFSIREPVPVPNPRMEWRRPTYEEVIERQQAFEFNPQWFEECARKRDLRQYEGRMVSA